MEQTVALKHVVCLNLVNDILKLLNYPMIKQLTDFKGVKRVDLMKKEVLELIESKEDHMFPPFDKKRSSYYDRKYKKVYTICLLKHMVKEVGFKLVSAVKSQGDGYDIKRFMVYNIE